MFDCVWRLLRWFSPIAYAATGVAAIAVVVVHFCNTTPAQTPPGSWLGLSALVGYAVWAQWTARKEYREAKQWRPRPPLNEARVTRVEWTPTRRPLTDPLRQDLLRHFALLELAGVTEPGEVTADEIIDAAEFERDYDAIDICAVAAVLCSLHRERDVPLKRVTVFQSQVDIYDEDILDIVKEFARLSEQGETLRGLRLTTTSDFAEPSSEELASGTEQPNAVVEFTLGTQQHSLPIVMFYKYLPLGLFEELADIFARPAEQRRFFRAYFLDMTTIILFAAPAKIAELNAATGTQEWPEPWRREF